MYLRAVFTYIFSQHAFQFPLVIQSYSHDTLRFLLFTFPVIVPSEGSLPFDITSMAAMIRESPAGQVIRWVTGNRVLRYPEEIPGFELPEAWNSILNSSEKKPLPPVSNSRSPSRAASAATTPTEGDFEDLEKEETTQDRDQSSPDSSGPSDARLVLTHTRSRQDTQPYTRDRFEVEEELAVEKTISKPVIPLKTSDGTVLVDWYTTDDPDNPQNWSNTKRFWIAFTINIYTFVVYCGSAIYTVSELQVIEKFTINPTEAALPLSLYVLGYGVGPLLFAPLSEIPAIGRSPIYFTTMIIFTILCVPTALVDNFAGLLVLRFLQGFFGSPCLANGAASMQDIYTMLYLPYALVGWVAAAYCGPALGPLLSGFAVMAKGWRWSLWEILWMAGPTLIVMFFFLPETSTPNILLRRAARLRKLTGNPKLQSQSEIDQRLLKPSAVIIGALVRSHLPSANSSTNSLRSNPSRSPSRTPPSPLSISTQLSCTESTIPSLKFSRSPTAHSMASASA
jgi:DHA1 family multidrug resistance protein-like MFS transporter